MYSPVRLKIPLLETGSLAKKLPSSYNIDDTLIKHILDSIEEETNEFRQACYDVEDIHNIDEKYGKNIDNFATDYDMYREGDADEDFLNKIRIKLNTRGSLGDNNTILTALGDYFSLDYSQFSTTITDIKKIDVGCPGDIDVDEVFEVVKSIKAAGIRLEVTPDKYWSDLNYEEPLEGSIAELTYEELEDYRYERG